MLPSALSLTAYRDKVGEEIGVSEWVLVDQDRIDRFADATLDHQFIHVDPEQAIHTAFGGTIAHGYLTLSLLSSMSYTALPAIEGTTLQVNYGIDSLRFLAPVRSGKRIRGRFTLQAMTERLPGQWLSTMDVEIEIEGESKPALVAKWVTLTYI